MYSTSNCFRWLRIFLVRHVFDQQTKRIRGTSRGRGRTVLYFYLPKPVKSGIRHSGIQASGRALPYASVDAQAQSTYAHGAASTPASTKSPADIDACKDTSVRNLAWAHSKKHERLANIPLSARLSRRHHRTCTTTTNRATPAAGPPPLPQSPPRSPSSPQVAAASPGSGPASPALAAGLGERPWWA